ncbi:MAG TPA: hypothetical protein VFN87_12055 [Solirubrobacteraceae bacterium]|nr:hypothetical protein [Solirubrobacteraceae bacterium]
MPTGASLGAHATGTLQAGFRTIRLTDERMRTRAEAEAARLHRILSAPPPPGG